MITNLAYQRLMSYDACGTVIAKACDIFSITPIAMATCSRSTKRTTAFEHMRCKNCPRQGKEIALRGMPYLPLSHAVAGSPYPALLTAQDEC